MKIRMIVTTKGSPDGIQVNEYQAGGKYDLPESLAKVFLDNNWAEEDKDLGRPKETKKTAKRKK